ncbi:MAG: hypothetical protein WC263_03110 [Candidatus Micrarchaeia archaeon]|jgi:hypothetical protein
MLFKHVPAEKATLKGGNIMHQYGAIRVNSSSQLNTSVISAILQPCFQNLFVNSKKANFFTLREQFCVGAVKGNRLVLGMSAMKGNALGEFRIDYNLKNNAFQIKPGHVDLTQIGKHDFYFFVYPESLPTAHQPSVHRATELLTRAYPTGAISTDARVGQANLKNDLARTHLTLLIETMVSAGDRTVY